MLTDPPSSPVPDAWVGPCRGAELQRLGAPTAMLVVDGLMCIGGQSGAISCFPQASLELGSLEGAFELRETGGVGRLLTSFFARCGQVPISASCRFARFLQHSSC